jgi:glycosyltransferase involved in cell wall biosynthesis
VRILFAAQLLPFPLDAGPKVRAYYVLRHLVEAGHHVHLLCFTRPSDSSQDIAELARWCASVETVPLERSRLRDLADGALSLASATPFLIRRDRRAEMRTRLRRLFASQAFDAFHADQLWMAPLADHCGRVGVRVLDQHNAVFKVPERLAAHHGNPAARWLLRGEAVKLERFERATVNAFDDVVWVSREDAAAVCGDAPRHGRHHVIPIAVDPHTNTPVRRSCPFRVTFLGGLHWPPNAEGVRWFVEHVWPRVATEAPHAVFTVIGKDAARAVRADSTARVDVRGYVADLRGLLAETAAFVVPLRTGAGMRVKILDAWCWGLPIVSTSVGAEGIDVVPGENILIADQSEEFADGLRRVLQDRALSGRIATNGRSTVEARYDWRRVYEAWGRIYH